MRLLGVRLVTLAVGLHLPAVDKRKPLLAEPSLSRRAKLVSLIRNARFEVAIELRSVKLAKLTKASCQVRG